MKKRWSRKANEGKAKARNADRKEGRKGGRTKRPPGGVHVVIGRLVGTALLHPPVPERENIKPSDELHE